jgi:serralysin
VLALSSTTFPIHNSHEKAGDTYLHADVNGDGGIDFSVRLDAAIDMRSTDFIL